MLTNPAVCAPDLCRWDNARTPLAISIHLRPPESGEILQQRARIPECLRFCLRYMPWEFFSLVIIGLHMRKPRADLLQIVPALGHELLLDRRCRQRAPMVSKTQ
jgi:hypothetical protein